MLTKIVVCLCILCRLWYLWLVINYFRHKINFIIDCVFYLWKSCLHWILILLRCDTSFSRPMTEIVGGKIRCTESKKNNIFIDVSRHMEQPASWNSSTFKNQSFLFPLLFKKITRFGVFNTKLKLLKLFLKIFMCPFSDYLCSAW